MQMHEKYKSVHKEEQKVNDETATKIEVPLSPRKPGDVWSKGTCAIVGDSILSGLQENLMSKDRSIKVRCFPGSTIDDMYFNIIPVIKKKPDFLILHVGTNDAKTCSETEILDKLLKLKHFILEQHKRCQIYLSIPILRTDSTKAAAIIASLRKVMLELNIKTIDHKNIKQVHLGAKGLHLKESAFGRLALNVLQVIRKF